jgi:hypothetical protein
MPWTISSAKSSLPQCRIVSTSNNPPSIKIVLTTTGFESLLRKRVSSSGGGVWGNGGHNANGSIGGCHWGGICWRQNGHLVWLCLRIARQHWECNSCLPPHGNDQGVSGCCTMDIQPSGSLHQRRGFYRQAEHQRSACFLCKR